MNDDVKAANWRERITAAIERITAWHSPMRIPADMTDPDIVLSDCLAHIEGEAARTAAAVAAAREEQRASDAQQLARIWYGLPDAGRADHGPVAVVRSTPLTATLLADRIAELEAERAAEQEWVDAVCHYRNLAIGLGARPEAMLNDLDRKLARDGVSLTERTPGYWSMADSLEELAAHWRNVDVLTAERDALRAQVERVRKVCAELVSDRCGVDDSRHNTAQAVLDALEEGL